MLIADLMVWLNIIFWLIASVGHFLYFRRNRGSGRPSVYIKLAISVASLFGFIIYAYVAFVGQPESHLHQEQFATMVIRPWLLFTGGTLAVYGLYQAGLIDFICDHFEEFCLWVGKKFFRA